VGDKKSDIKSQEEMDKVLEELKGATFSVTDIKKGERIKKAPLPFTTSTLQQEASKQLNFSTQKTMRLAQQLYEDGIITYLRTDSTRVSDEAITSSKEYITENYGEEYAAKVSTEKKSDQKIQDAHEAIRPTDIAKTPAEFKDSLARDLFRLYQLIWKRFTASRMTEARYDTTSVKIDANGHRFTVSASKLAFEGFMSVYKDDDEEKSAPNTLVKEITKDTVLTLGELDPKQHFTQPPAHYTEASLVRALEELGIGRPSTYAPTITTILARHYIIKEDKNLYVSELGEVVNNMMVDAFPTIVDVNFTANLEALLDKVEAGSIDWKTVMANFYPDLDEAVKKAEKELEHVEIKDEESDEICDVCGRNMVIKYGPHGKFLACPGFPDCRNTKPYFEKIGVQCPKCGKEIVVKKTKKGRRYYGCEGYPECDYMVWQKPTKEKMKK
jgi:DNA topoisomerase-1